MLIDLWPQLSWLSARSNGHVTMRMMVLGLSLAIAGCRPQALPRSGPKEHAAPRNPEDLNR